MKNQMKTALLSLFALVSYAAAPVETLVPVENIYSPYGFDSNDNTEIVIEGYLPNLCHKSPLKKFEIKGNKIEVTISALKYDDSNPFCPQIVVPFLETIDVGVLDKGNYEIVVNGKSLYEKKSAIRVNESSSDAIDETVYANVEYVEKQLGSQFVKLKGHNPSDCFVFDGVEILDNKKDVYSVLPKMKQISDFCPKKMVSFSYEVKVPKKLKQNKVLLHVRVMNGKSVNSVFRNSED